MADLATAYLQLVPSLRGAQKTIEGELAGIGQPAGKKMGKGLGEGILGNIGGIAKKAASIFAKAFAAKKVFDFGKAAFDAYADFEQLAGGAEKIFSNLDQSKILADANGAFLTLNMSANEYLESINSVGATFAQTMGQERGYETAKRGMQAIADFASGTGANLNELNDKYKLITRSAGSYQSIADQFAGILPQTSKDFLDQAKAAGLLKDEYEELTDVPVAEYQEAVTAMIEKGVEQQGLAGNTAAEALKTLSGSMAATKAAWQNLVTEIGKPDADIGARIKDMMTALMGDENGGGMLRNVATEVGVIARNMISGVGTAIGMAADWLLTNGPAMLGNAMSSIGDAIERGWTALLDFRSDFNLVDALFGEDGESGIVPKVISFVQGIGNAIVENWPYIQGQLGILWEEIVATVQQYGPQILAMAGDLLGRIGTTILEKGPELATKGAELLLTFAENITSQGPQLVTSLATTIGNAVTTAVTTAKGWLVANGPAILEAAKTMFMGVGQAIIEHGPQILANVTATVATVVGYIAGAAGQLLSAALEWFGGLLEGATQKGQEVLDWVAGIPGRILDSLGDLSSLLLNAGSNIIAGLKRGIEAEFENVKSFVSGIGSWIAAHKGPKAYDLGLLVQNGQWIMQGLGDGLVGGIPTLEGALADVTSAISGGVPSTVGVSMVQKSMGDALASAYPSPQPYATNGAYATQGTGWGELADAMNGMRGDLGGLGIYLDGKTLVGGISARMDRALVM